MAGKLGNLIIGIGLDLKGLSKDLNRVSYKLNRQASKLKSAGSAMSSAITLPLLAIGATGIKMSLDLEKSLNKITNLVGVSSGDLAKYKKDLVIISNETGKSQTELAKALFDLTSAGLSGDKALAALRKSAKASAIGLGETQVVASAVSSAMNAYESSSLSAAKATEVLAATVRYGKLSAEELAPAIGQVLPIASALGVTFDQVGANIATFTRLGIDSKQAATALKSLLAGFSGAAGKKAADALDSIGLSMDGVRKKIREDGLLATLEMLNEKTGGNVETLSAIIPNIRAFSNVLGTVGAQGDTYREVLDGIEKSQTLVADGFDKVKQSAGFKLTKAINELKNVGIQIGDILLPFVIKFAKVLSNLVKKFNDLSTPIKSTIVLIGLIVSAIGPLLLIVGTLLSSFAAITTTLSISAAAVASFVSAVTGIGAAIAAVTAVTFVIKGLTSLTEEAGSAKDQLAESEKEYTRKIKEERIEANKLFSVLEDCNTSIETKKRAHEDLLAIYPGILSNYNVEQGDLEALTVAQNQVTESIKNRIRAEGLSKEKLASIEKEIDLEDQLYKVKKEGLKGAIGFSGVLWNNIKNTFTKRIDGETQAEANVRSYTNALEDQIAVEKEKQSLLDKESEKYKVKPLVVPPVTPAAPDGTPDDPDTPPVVTQTEAEITRLKLEAAEDRAKRIEAIRKGQINTIEEEQAEELSQLKLHYDKLIKDDLAGHQDKIDLADSYHEQREAMEKSHQTALSDMSKNEFVSGAAGSSPFDGLGAPVGFDLMFAAISNNVEALSAYEEKLQKIKEVLSTFAEESVMGLADSFGSILENFNGFGDAAKRMGLSVLSAVGSTMQKLGKIIIVGSKAMATLRKYLESFGAIGAGASIAGGIALFALGKAISARVSKIGSNKLPKLAKGGVLSSEQLFIGGEYSGAANNPEIVTPQNIMAETFRKVLGQSGGGSGVGVLHMDTIRFGLEKDNLRVT